MSTVGMPSVMQTASGSFASAASMIASAPPGGGTKITDALAPVFSTASRHRVEHRPALVRRPALAGRDAADDVRAVGLRLLRVKRALASRDALDDETGRFVDEYGHMGIGARESQEPRALRPAVGCRA